MRTITITMNEKNYNYCKSIADEIDAYINGELCRCPECGEEIEYNPDGEFWMSCPHCNEEIHPESRSLYDCLADALDIEYTVRKGDNDITGCRVLVTYGGPNVYIDTNVGKVQLYWWNEYAEYPLSCEAIEEINDVANEFYNC